MNKLNRKYNEMNENEKNIFKGLMVFKLFAWIFYLAGWVVGFMALMSFVDAAFDDGIYVGWLGFFLISSSWLVCIWLHHGTRKNVLRVTYELNCVFEGYTRDEAYKKWKEAQDS